MIYGLMTNGFIWLPPSPATIAERVKPAAVRVVSDRDAVAKLQVKPPPCTVTVQVQDCDD